MTGHAEQRYKNHRQTLFSLLDRLARVLPEQHLLERLQRIRTDLEKEQFRLVVLGQFKRGKSTFINALLGKAILPTDVIPVTAVITEIRYGEEARAKIHFLEGEPKEVPLEELDQFVTEEKNPHNQKSVDKVLLFSPAEILKNGVILVDTPGVGSIHEHNTRLTREYIPQVDAAIFLFSADPPLTELEQSFLKTILPLVPRLIFVLNKKDYLPPESLNRVLAFNQEVLHRLTGEEVTVHAISALQGLQSKLNPSGGDGKQSGLPELERELHEFLVTSRGRFIILSNADRIRRVCLEWRNLREMEEKARNLSLEKLNANLEKFTHYMSETRRKSQHLEFLLNGIKMRLLEFFDAKSSQFIGEQTPLLVKELHSLVDNSDHLSKKKLMESLEVESNNQIIDRFEPFRLLMEKEIRAKYVEEIEAINQDVKNILREIYRFSARLFQLEALAESEEDIWQYKSQFYYKTWDPQSSLDLIENLIITYLPRPLFLTLQKRHLQKHLPLKFERQRGLLRADILYALQDNNRQFLYEFQRMIEQIQEEISDLIKKQIQLKNSGQEENAQQQQVEAKIDREISSVLDTLEKIQSVWKEETFESDQSRNEVDTPGA